MAKTTNVQSTSPSDEILIVQVGQCGNQVGYALWELVINQLSKQLLHKHCSITRSRVKEDGSVSVKANVLCIDTEEGVINYMRKGRIGSLFNFRITDVSGAGNNWAHGYYEYGPLYRESVLNMIELIRRKYLHRLKAILMIYSSSGGTGSGLGSFLLHTFEEEYPELFKIVFMILPNMDTPDVITSPYNSFLSLRSSAFINKTIVFILPNNVLFDLTTTTTTATSKSTGYTRVNEIIASIIFIFTESIHNLSNELNVLLETNHNINTILYHDHRYLKPLIYNVDRYHIHKGILSYNLTNTVKSWLSKPILFDNIRHKERLLKNSSFSPFITDVELQNSLRDNKYLNSFKRMSLIDDSYFHITNVNITNNTKSNCILSAPLIAYVNSQNLVSPILHKNISDVVKLFKHRAHFHHYEEYGLESSILSEWIEEMKGCII